jgi:hypothetical protein
LETNFDEQTAKKKEIPWWQTQEKYGALLLGQAAKNLEI